MELQSRFGTDERFRMDSRFLEEDEDKEEESGEVLVIVCRKARDTDDMSSTVTQKSDMLIVKIQMNVVHKFVAELLVKIQMQYKDTQ